jgi:hypothetical protein
VPDTTPDFFIAGAPKAGTDALYYDLDQHPEIYMSPLKEPCYFSSEIRLENFDPAEQARRKGQRESIRKYVHGPMTEKRFGGVVSEWDDYLRLFAGARGEKAIGEGSVCYLWSRTAAQAIASRLPEARIIIVLMDPAERAFAQYLKSVSNGSFTYSFEEHLKACRVRRDTRLGLLHPFLEFGLYADQVQRYMTVFPSRQLHISFHEDASADPERWFARVLEFLGVDPSFVPERGRGEYHAAVPRFARFSSALRAGGIWKAIGKRVPGPLRNQAKKLVYRQPESIVLAPSEREILIEYYRNDILKLQALMNRDLGHWLR